MACARCAEYVTAEYLHMTPEEWDETHPLSTLSETLGVSVDRLRDSVDELLGQQGLI